jgi:hypothetical protein
MVGWIFGLVILLLLGTIFYKQSIEEFRFNQIEYDQRHELEALYEERVPIVVRNMPKCPVWTQEDVMIRDFYGSERIPGTKKSLRETLLETDRDGVTWSKEYRNQLFSATAAQLWFEKYWSPVLTGLRGWLGDSLPTVGECYYGSRGLYTVTANWQLIVPTEGKIVVSLMTSSQSKYFPKKWRGMFPSKMTKKTVPFVDELKYVDVIVREGTGIWVPAHWHVAWEGADNVVPYVITVDVHTPISWLATRRAK